MTSLDLQKEILEGCIPIEVMVHDGDNACFDTPDPVALLASRMGYIPQITGSIVEYLQSLAIEFHADVWFEAGGVPLKR